MTSWRSVAMGVKTRIFGAYSEHIRSIFVGAYSAHLCSECRSARRWSCGSRFFDVRRTCCKHIRGAGEVSRRIPRQCALPHSQHGAGASISFASSIHGSTLWQACAGAYSEERLRAGGRDEEGRCAWRCVPRATARSRIRRPLLALSHLSSNARSTCAIRVMQSTMGRGKDQGVGWAFGRTR